MTDEPKARAHVDDLRGVGRLAIDATTGVMGLVEAMHRTIASGPGVLGSPLAAPARAVTGLVYGAIKGVTRAVGVTIDAALATLGPLLGDSAPGAQRALVQAALNGVLGDYLADTANPLAMPMVLHHADARPRLVVLVHGLAMHHGQWLRNGHDHGAALAAELDATAIYVDYNSGRHISTNGAALAVELERLVTGWPCPVESIVIVGHSLGGLVARSACEAARVAGHAWLGKLTTLVTLGSPHHGAALERGGNWFEALLGVSAYSAPFRVLGQIRSAGVTDLRFGNVVDADWQGADRFALAGDPRTPLALPVGVACYAIAATTAPEPCERLPGDGLVGVTSALGQHDRSEHVLRFADRHLAFGLGHLDLLDAPAVAAKLREWLAIQC
ncbi:MAG: alpha/beta hydrolase [Kofleriaceae bacterium]